MADRRYTFEYKGRRYTIEGPDGMTESDLAAAIDKEAEKSRPGMMTRNIAEPFNRGIAQSLDAPVDLMNAALRGSQGMRQTPQNLSPMTNAGMLAEFGTNDLTQTAARNNFQLPAGGAMQMAQNIGAVSPPEQQSHGVVPRTMEILGGSVLPTGAMATRGKQLLSSATPRPTGPLPKGSVAPPPPGGVNEMMKTVVERPGMVAAGEVGASALAATGGEVARGMTDNPLYIALAELGTGFIGPAGVLVATKMPAARLAGGIKNAVAKHIAPFTEAGARPRAADRLQGLAADPLAAAAGIDKYPNLPPAIATGDKRLIGLYERFLRDNPSADKAAELALKARREELRAEGTSFLGGDTAAPRKAAEASRRRIITIAETRAQLAAENAQRKLEEINVEANPREASVVVRNTLESALDDARKAEKKIWATVNLNAPATIENTENAINGILAERGRYANPEDLNVPVLRRLLGELNVDKQLRDQLEAAGLIRPGEDVPVQLLAQLKAQGAIEQPTFTLGDLQDIRSQLLAEIRKEKAQPAPNWNRVRLMENIANGADDGTGGILDDMLATGVSGVEEAHAFSRGLNEKFTRGEMGKILGYGRRGGDAVSPENTMSVVYGKETGRTMDQMIAAAPESRGQIEGWLKSHYLEAVVPGGKFDAGAHRMFMRRMRERGVFERFPELEQQFNQAATATNRAEALGKRAANVRSMSYDGGRSRAALYLNSPTGTEMDRLLEQRSRASIFARGIVRKVGNDPVARQGLKAEFVESVFRASSREDTELGPVLNGASARVRFRELDRNGTMDALGFTAAEKKRLADIVDEVTLIDRKPKDIPDDLVGDAASEAAQFLARWSGANVGGATSKGGASLQSAQIASSKFRQILNKLTTNKAARLIADAQNDPELYKALLTTSRDSTERQKQAFDKIQNWMLGAAATQDERE